MDFVRSGEKEVKECKDVRCEGVHNLGMAKGKVNICTGRRDIHIVGGNGGEYCERCMGKRKRKNIVSGF